MNLDNQLEMPSVSAEYELIEHQAYQIENLTKEIKSLREDINRNKPTEPLWYKCKENLKLHKPISVSLFFPLVGVYVWWAGWSSDLIPNIGMVGVSAALIPYFCIEAISLLRSALSRRKYKHFNEGYKKGFKDGAVFERKMQEPYAKTEN